MAFAPKPSTATRWWLGTLATVLLALFLETRGARNDGANFLINTGAQARAAEVIVDGRKLGVVLDSHASGLAGGAFWGHLSSGRHVVELRKPGFHTFAKVIEMRGEEYLGVDLKPLTN